MNMRLKQLLRKITFWTIWYGVWLHFGWNIALIAFDGSSWAQWIRVLSEFALILYLDTNEKRLLRK